jgi:hypothetical protein
LCRIRFSATIEICSFLIRYIGRLAVNICSLVNG